MADRQGELAALVEAEITRLPRSKPVEGGTELEFFCPAHEGSDDPHAYWNRRRGTWHCQKCKTSGSTADLAKRLGVALKADSNREAADFRVTKEYDYRAEDGTLIFQVVRVGVGKNFRVRRPSGNSARPWEWNRKGVVPPLYRLHEISRAGPDDWILFVEGEKDADRARAQGYPYVTTNPFGATEPTHDGHPGKPKWEPQFTESLRGKSVALCLDADPAGQNHQRQIRNILAGHARRVRLITLPGLPSERAGAKLKDLSDWFDLLGGSLEDLHAIIDAAPDEAATAITEEFSGDDILRFAMTDAGNGELFAHLYGPQVRRDHLRGRWLVWKGHWWGLDSDGQLHRWAVDMARKRASAASEYDDEATRKRAFKFAVSAESAAKVEATLKMAAVYPPVADPGQGWDASPFLLGVGNGVVNLSNGMLRPGHQDDRITLSSPLNFNPHAQCPRWLQFLDEIFEGDREMIDYIHRAVGYSLTGSAREQIWFICYGKGANGKSTFLEVLARAFGDYAGNLPFTALMKGREQAIPTDLAALPGKRFITSSETQENSTLNEARIKALTGGDTVTARQLYERQFQFQPELKLWAALNHLPQVTDSSEGFWRRVRVIGFNRIFRGFERDNDLKEKLFAELDGILNWAVQGAALYHDSGLPVPTKVILATNDYRADADSFERFISECCVISPNASVPASNFYLHYTAWATKEGIRPNDQLTNVGFGKRCIDLYIKTRKTKGFYYVGVGIRADDEALHGNDVQLPYIPPSQNVGYAGQTNSLPTNDLGGGEIYHGWLQNPTYPTSIHPTPCVCPGRHENDENPCPGADWWEEPENGELHCSVCHPEIANEDENRA